MDLAVLARDPIPNLRRFELAQELAVRFHRDVDLINLRNAPADASPVDRNLPGHSEWVSSPGIRNVCVLVLCQAQRGTA